MNTHEIAQKLVTYCRNHEEQKAYSELYSRDITSIESAKDFGVSEGIDAVLKKAEWWYGTFEVHSSQVSDPLVADSFFAVTYSMDTTERATGKREQMTELAVYEVRDGKIVKEQFFYRTA